MPSFSLMIRPPPISPLFPYTTLFRSFSPVGHGGFLPERMDHVEVGAEGEWAGDVVVGVRVFRQAIQDQIVTLFGMSTGAATPGDIPKDRKSTRLNSSHMSISYAVFFFNDTPTTYISTLSLHDALPIFFAGRPRRVPA